MNNFFVIFNSKRMFSLAITNDPMPRLELGALIFFVLNEISWIPSHKAKPEYMLSQGGTQVICLIFGLTICWMLLDRKRFKFPVRVMLLAYIPAKIYSLIAFALYHLIAIPLIEHNKQGGQDFSEASRTIGFIFMYCILFGIIGYHSLRGKSQNRGFTF